MKRTLSLAVALLVAGAFSAPALAQAQPEVIITHEMSTSDLHMDELNAFGQLAAANPRLARRLSADPWLVKNKSFLRKNAELSAFFAKYPGSKERFLQDPGNYLPGVRMAHGRVVMWGHRHKAMHKKPAAATKTEKKMSEKKPEKSETAPAAEPAKP